MIDFNVEQLANFHSYLRNGSMTDTALLYLQVKLLNQTMCTGWSNGIKLSPFRDPTDSTVTLLRFGVSEGKIVGYVEEDIAGEAIFMSLQHRPILLEQDPRLVKPKPILKEPTEEPLPTDTRGDYRHRDEDRKLRRLTYTFPTTQRNFLRQILFTLTDMSGKAHALLGGVAKICRPLQPGEVYYLDNTFSRENPNDPLEIGTQVTLLMQSTPWIDKDGKIADCQIGEFYRGTRTAHSGDLFTLGEMVERLDPITDHNNGSCNHNPKIGMSPLLIEVLRELESLRK